MKYVLVFVMVMMMVGCRSPDKQVIVNTDGFEDYEPWWLTNQIEEVSDGD